MSNAAFTKKTPYLDTEDTLDEVGITRRQLNYWRAKGLLVPEYGEAAKRFTEKDIRLLKFARRLIVEQGFPVEIAKRFIEATRASRPWEEPELGEFAYLDLDSGTLYTKASLGANLWFEFGATSNDLELESRLYDIALLIFRVLRLKYPDAEDYEKKRDTILRQISNWEQVARCEWKALPDEDQPRLHLEPLLDGETSLTAYRMEDWFEAATSRLGDYEFAASEIDATPGQWKRFWDHRAKKAAREAAKRRCADKGEHADVFITLDEVPF